MRQLAVVMLMFFFLMIRRPPRSTRTDTLFPYTPLFRSIGAQGGVQRQNYLAPDESDRDLTTWRGSVRVSAQLAAGRDVFLLGFVNRRDHRLSVDRSGLDRDATTLGFLKIGRAHV